MWQRWLVVVSVMSAVCGFVLVLAMVAGGLPWVDPWLLRPIVGSGPASREALAVWRFAGGVTGAVMTGWSFCALFIAAVPFARGERWAWWGLSTSVAAWFVLDQTISATSGVWSNFGGNLVFALLFAVPLIATAPRFLRARPGHTASVQTASVP